MWKMCWLMAVLVMLSLAVASHGSDHPTNEAESEPSMDDVIRSVRQDPDQVLCGTRPAMRSKRQVNMWIRIQGPNRNASVYTGTGPLRRGEAPWHVNIFAANGQVCGGAIISEYWVVTSASCATSSVGRDESWLTVGDVIRGTAEKGEQRFGTATMIAHPRFRPDIDRDYDIALVKVAATPDGRGIRFNPYVQPICLPDEGTDVLPDMTRLIITGLPDSFDGNAFKIDLVVMNHARCFTEFSTSFRISENMLCAFKDDFTQRQRCHGLEGLPAAYRKDDFYILAGIRSANIYCNPIILANLFTLTSPWIHESIVESRNNLNESVMPSRPDWE